MLLSPFTDEENQVQVQVPKCWVTLPGPQDEWLATVTVKLVVEVWSPNRQLPSSLLFSCLKSGPLRQVEEEESYKDSVKQGLNECVITTPSWKQYKGTRAEAGQASKPTQWSLMQVWGMLPKDESRKGSLKKGPKIFLFAQSIELHTP